MTEIRLSPDGSSVAIRSTYPIDSEMAYGVMHKRVGGHWAPQSEVIDWPVVPELDKPGE